MKYFLFLLALASCGEHKNSKKTYELTPLSEAQSRALRADLREGNVPGPNEDLNKFILDNNGSLEADECKSFKDKLPKNYTTATIEVPEDYSNPQSPKIKVFYYYDLSGGGTPIAFYNGGPAADSHSSEQVLRDWKAPFVFIDQRGNGCSSLYPKDFNRLIHYGTREIVMDSEMIRKTLLGKKPWKIFGQSFGGDIVHRYATIAPEGLEGAYAHGYALMKEGLDMVVDRLLSQDRVYKEYEKIYPADTKLLSNLRKLITDDTCFMHGQKKVCGNFILDASLALLGFHNTWSQLHDWLNALAPNDVINERVLKQFVQYFVFEVYDHNSIPGTAIQLVEMESEFSTLYALPYCNEVYKRIRALNKDPESFVFNECRLFINLDDEETHHVLDTITYRDLLKLSDFNESLQHSNLDFHLYSGQLDIFVPVEMYGEETALLGDRIHYTNFLTSGHDGFYTEAQVKKDVLDIKN